MKCFASDNYSGVHPLIMDAILKANGEHEPAYGDDSFTKELQRVFARHFGQGIEVWPVFTGTAANTLGLAAVLKPWQAVICNVHAHIHVHECGAPEHYTGCKLWTVDRFDGKLEPEDIETRMHDIDDEHVVQPRVVSISQPTEVGTLYTIEEVRLLADVAHAHQMLLHMDGARISNAAAALDYRMGEFSLDAGVDFLSFGATKNGLMCGEAVVFSQNRKIPEFKYIRKQGMQLASKMRYLSAQLIAALESELWRENADNANQMAKRLADGLRDIPHVHITRDVQVNMIFATMPRKMITALQERTPFYENDPAACEIRLVTSWDTTTSDVDWLLQQIEEVVGEV